MKQILQHIKGDKGIWSFVALLALFSFMPVFSASSNLAYMKGGTGNTLAYLLRHFMHICIGFFFLYRVQKIPYHYFKFASRVILPVIWILLIITMLIGKVQGGASRWIQIPVIGLSFQPSAFASLVLMVFVARYLAKIKTTPDTFKESIINLWVPVGITLALILTNNFSTAALIFLMVLMLAFVGNYPWKRLLSVIGLAFTAFAFFIMVAKVVQKTNPEHVPRVFARVATWEKRVDTYFKDEKIEDRETSDANYQIEKAKTAIATGGLYGLGPGKSVQKNFLPQSASDFIFAIIVEEYGLIIGGLGVMTLYLLLFFRFIVTAHKAQSEFGRLLIIGLGFPIIFQAMINMAVAVQLLPVTGQTLPLLSSGGSSIWVTCLSIGIIISVTKKHEEVEQEQKDKEQNRIEQDKRAEILNKLIDGELEKENSETDDILESKPKTSRKKTEIIEESDFSISESNPMNAVINKK